MTCSVVIVHVHVVARLPLQIECTQLTSASIAYLGSKCPNLTAVDLYGSCNNTDAHIHVRLITCCHFAGASFLTDVALLPFMDGRTLKLLNLAESNVTGTTLQNLAERCDQVSGLVKTCVNVMIKCEVVFVCSWRSSICPGVMS